MSAPSLSDLVFFLIAGLTVVSAGGVAFSRNIVYSAFSLMGTFLGVAGLYIFLAADFIALVQVLLYVGGILVLLLFAVMLTHRIGDIRISNRAVGSLPALAAIAVVGAVMAKAVTSAEWHAAEVKPPGPTAAHIGNLFLTDYLLPFELASVVLLSALIGAVVLSRKELRD
ncbi:MAG TPA: NADH-quinone oxidoreductase subunit J [Terriglobales bacterium]|nr:NADH-quinone oxidoreductase subunit J [Terriglobales bacterium]